MVVGGPLTLPFARALVGVDPDADALEERQPPGGGLLPGGQVRLEVTTVSVLVSVLELVERRILEVEQAPVRVKRVLVDHSGKGQFATP